MTIMSDDHSVELFNAALSASRPGQRWYLRAVGYMGMALLSYFLVLEFLFSLGCLLLLLYFAGGILLHLAFGWP